MAKIAIVEDNLALAQMYRLKLEAWGHHAEIAENGRLGLELCERMKPDLLLLDLMMPEMNGDEMLEKMRATEWGKDIRVMVLTNVGEQEAPDKFRSLHVSSYIAKAEMSPEEVAVAVKKELSA